LTIASAKKVIPHVTYARIDTVLSHAMFKGKIVGSIEKLEKMNKFV
jgi:hypothetical protein